MRAYVLTELAQADLTKIFDYIERENAAAAVRVAGALRAATRLLAERPGIGHVRLDLAKEDIRFWPVFSYLIVYRRDTEPLEIVRVLHGATDVRRLLER